MDGFHRSVVDATEGWFTGAWDDGRPKEWPTIQLRIRGRPFDVYCQDPTDVTLDAFGIPVVCGRTASRTDLKRGWLVAPA
jgi:hypothetical protein